MNDTAAAKASLRREMRERLHSLTPADTAAWSAALCERLLASHLLDRPGPVMLFAPLPGEVDLSTLAAALHADGRTVCLPRVGWQDGTLRPAVAGWPWDHLAQTRHALREPPDDAPAIPPAQLAAVIVPGLAFDELANRLGRGAGFYDRFLSHPGLAARKVGVGFDLQVVARVPTDALDVPLDAVATERRIVGPAARV
ncbi:MAG: 5-formyltetrahydrofolate cyclo-ligase [Phycisphaeraceae bacterium]|nr:5-formyltetrahydrofolate cyclo-ligase [Phycisphaeraceae bacterium]